MGNIKSNAELADRIRAIAAESDNAVEVREDGNFLAVAFRYTLERVAEYFNAVRNINGALSLVGLRLRHVGFDADGLAVRSDYMVCA